LNVDVFLQYKAVYQFSGGMYLNMFKVLLVLYAVQICESSYIDVQGTSSPICCTNM